MVLMECTVYLYREFGKNKKKQIVLDMEMAVLILYAVCNLSVTITGYKNNYGINQKNHDTYANMMPYQNGYGFIENWMKRYYGLPDEVVFQWQ